MSRILAECPGCGRKDVKHASRGLCPRCASRERRKDPEERRKDREASRRWKARHPNRDKRAHSSKREQVPQTPPAYPAGSEYCKGCGIRMLDPATLCGFCKEELPPHDKLRIMELIPGQDERWVEYFSLLSHPELAELIDQANKERARRVMEHMKTVLAKNTYRIRGDGTLATGPPDHHRRCETCKQLIVNCPHKGEHPSVANA